MNKIVNIGRPEAKDITEEAVRILSEHFKSRGITVRRGNATYSPESLTAKITFNVQENSKGVAIESPEAFEYDKFRTLYSLPPRGTSFKASSGKVYTISGWKDSSRKYKVLAKNSSGVAYKFAVTDILRYCK